MSPRNAKIVRYGILGVSLATVLGVAWAFRPDRTLDPTHYTSALPIKHAELRDGVFLAVVDDSKWPGLRIWRAHRQLTLLIQAIAPVDTAPLNSEAVFAR